MSAVLDELQDLISRLRDSPDVLAACLVGSYARETSDPDAASDIDVLAVIRDDADEAIRRSLVGIAKLQSGDRPIELRAIRQAALH